MSAGYGVTAIIPRFLPYTTRSALPQYAFLIKLYLRMPIVWKILGKQFLLIAERPRGGR